jgi:DNA-binding MarR family transcriptional regulator
LAALTLTDRSSVSVVVDRLVRAGLATRQTAAADRRRADVRITRAGLAMLRRAPAPPTEILIRALRRMPRATVRRLAQTLAALNAELGFQQSTMLFEER